jgi:hypothetical protein
MSVEMRGAGGPSILFETGPENGWVVEVVKEWDPRPLANSSSMEVYRRLPNDTDFTPFRDAGVQGLNFAAIGRSNRYHQASDRPENVQEATVQHHGVRLLALTRAFGDADLTEVNAPDQAYVTLPFLGLVSLPVHLTLPISGGLVLALLVVTFLASVRGTRSRGFLLSAVLSSLAVALSALAGWAILRWALPVHAVFGTGAMTPAVHQEGPYLLAIAAAALGITVTLYSLGHRWMSPLEATLGALFLPVVALVAVTFMAPAAAINLQGPLAATVFLLLLLTGVGIHRARGMVAWVASLILALPVLAILVPVLELAAAALTLSAAPILGGMIALALLFLLPALSALDEPNRWWAPLTAFLVVGASLGIGWFQRAPSADEPAPSTLLYALERNSEGLPSSARWVTVESPGTSWASEAAGGPLADTSGLQGFAVPARSYLTRDAPLEAVPAPELRVFADTVVGGQRRVSLGVRSRMGAEYLAVSLPEGVDALTVWGASSGLPRPGLLTPSVRRVVHWGRPDDWVRLDLVGRPGAEWTLEVVEHLLRPEEIFGPDRYSRPVGLGGFGPELSDRVMVRMTYALAAPEASGASGPAPASPEAAAPVDTAAADTLRPTAPSDGPGDRDTLAAQPPSGGASLPRWERSP